MIFQFAKLMLQLRHLFVYYRLMLIKNYVSLILLYIVQFESGLE